MKPIKLLLADNDTYSRRGITHYLQNNFSVSLIKEVAFGYQAIKETTTQDWNLAILELGIEKGIGLDVLTQMKLLNPRLPVVVLSGFCEEVYGIRALKSGAAGYVSKKSPPCTLGTAIDKAFNGKRFVTGNIAEKYLPHRTVMEYEKLSNRELEVYRLLFMGRNIQQIADILMLEPATVVKKRCSLMAKLNCASDAALIKYAMDHRIFAG